jgi:flagella basal body P-ring formation protein FlgA
VRRLLLLLAVCAAAENASAATLKPYSTLSGATVRLSDLWDGVSVDKPLGPAPGPGGRITVPAAQLAAIARQFGVDWQPNSSGDRVILERLGRALTRDDVRPALQSALINAGAEPDADLEISFFTAPLLPQDAQPEITVSQIELDKLSGRFSAQLDIATSDAPNTQLRITGRIQEMVDVPVARHRIMPGDVVAASDLDWLHLPRALAHGEVVHVPADAVGLAAKQTIAPNLPIRMAELGRPVLVQKGDKMTLSLESPGLSLTAHGTATEPGGIGERIRVLNDYARVTVEAEITGPGEARVVPGTARPANHYVADR